MALPHGSTQLVLPVLGCLTNAGLSALCGMLPAFKHTSPVAVRAEEWHEMLRDAAVFSLNELVMRPWKWPLFEDVADSQSVRKVVPAVSGVYILGLPTHYLSYPGGYSHVLYIGEAIDLHARLVDHFKFTDRRRATNRDSGRFYSHYEWSSIHGLIATWSASPRDDKSDAKAYEQQLLYWFAELYGAAPLGNAQAAWREAEQSSLQKSLRRATTNVCTNEDAGGQWRGI